MPSLTEFRSSNAPRKGNGREAKRILVVNDDVALAEMLKWLLEQHGYECLVATNTDWAMAIVTTLNVDLIIQDIKRPGKDGWTFHRLLKSDPSLINIPIVILSAAPRQSQEYMAEQLNEIADYLQAPCDFDEVLESVRTCLALADDSTD